MKITVLVGNGLDISLGIKSSYGDFYKWYCTQKSDVAHIQKFRDDIKEDMSRNVPAEEKTWADFELGLGKYTANFTPDNVDEFVDCLEDAQASIREYLRIEQGIFAVDQFTDDSISSLRLRLKDFYTELPEIERDDVINSINSTQNEHREIQFITFNYTDSLEKILEHIPDERFGDWSYGATQYGYKLSKNVHHVHGSVNEFPVLGVNDESQIENKQLLNTPQFRDYLIKSSNITALGMRWHSYAENQISQSRIVCLYGMSLGATDAKWWRKLAQWLKASGNRHLILYWYMRNPPNRIMTIRHLKTITWVKDKFLSFSEQLSETDKQNIKSRIHVVINSQNFLGLDKKPKKGKVLTSASGPTMAQYLVAAEKANAVLSDPIIDKFNKSEELLQKINGSGIERIERLIEAHNHTLDIDTKL